MTIKSRLKKALKRIAVCLFILALLYVFNSRMHAGAYDELLKGKTETALRMARFIATWEPIFYLHRGHMGKKALLRAFQETGQLVREKRVAWIFKTPKPVVSSPAYSAGAIYVGSNSGFLYKLNIKNGKLIWKYDTGAAAEPKPLVVGGRVFVASHNGLHAVSAEDGRRLWYRELGWDESYPESSDGLVYSGEQNGTVYAFDVKTGKTKWSFDSGGEMEAGFAFDGGNIIFGSHSGIIHALNKDTGRLVWKYEIGGGMEGKPLVMGGVVYMGSRKGNLAALDARTGRRIWQKNLGGPIDRSAAGAQGIIVVGIGSQSGKVIGLNPHDGAVIWTLSNTGPVESSPAISDGVVYIGSHYGFLFAIDLKTGKLLWRFITGWDIDESVPLVAGNLVIIGSMDGRVYALKTK